MANEIAKLATVELESEQGPVYGVSIALNVDTPRETRTFALHVIEQFKVQRMCSPPDTSVLIVSVIGPVDLQLFRETWIEQAASDQALAFFLSRMRDAACVHGTRDGRVLATVSLLPTAAA